MDCTFHMASIIDAATDQHDIVNIVYLLKPFDCLCFFTVLQALLFWNLVCYKYCLEALWLWLVFVVIVFSVTDLWSAMWLNFEALFTMKLDWNFSLNDCHCSFSLQTWWGYLSLTICIFNSLSLVSMLYFIVHLWWVFEDCHLFIVHCSLMIVLDSIMPLVQTYATNGFFNTTRNLKR